MRTTFRRVSALFTKDLKDAIRDARVLIALILPIGIGLFYNLSFDDNPVTLFHPTVALYHEDETVLLEQVSTVLTGVAEMKVVEYEDRAGVESAISSDDASIGLIVPAGFDAAVKAGESPTLTVIRSPSSSVPGDYVLSALEPALRQMAGQTFPVKIDVVRATEAEPDNVVDKIGLRTWSLAIAIMMMIALIAALAIPIVLAEEFEKKTIDALVLAMPYREVIAAKAGLGLFYIAVSTIIFLAVTRLEVVGWGWFVLGVGLTSIASLGFGLLLAGLFKNANQLNTWSGLFLTPFILPAIVIGQPLPDAVQSIAEWFPSGAGMKLLLRSLTAEKLFTDSLSSALILIGWAAIAYGALLWQLKRRQA